MRGLIAAGKAGALSLGCALILLGSISLLRAPAASAEPSAISDQHVLWLAVSPVYGKSHFVVASTAQTSACLRDCYHIWVTRDGGATWVRKKAAGFTTGRPVIAADAAGRETIFNLGESELQRSGDDGDTWTRAGPKGFPTPIPDSPDGAVAVAGAVDYILRGNVTQTVTGSGGAINDRAFFFAPSFPKSGPYPPALLVGADKTTNRVVIQQCKADLSCSGNSVMRGSGNFGNSPIPPDFFPSADYARDGVVFARAGRVTYKSRDGGFTFEALRIAHNGAAETAVPMMAIAWNYGENRSVRTAYAAIFQVFEVKQPDGSELEHNEGGIYRSNDGGKTWRKVGSPGPFDTGASAVAVAPDGRIFAGSLSEGFQGGLFCNYDDKYWRVSCPAPGMSGKGSPPVSGLTTTSQKAKSWTSNRFLVFVAIFAGGLILSSAASALVRRAQARRKEVGLGNE